MLSRCRGVHDDLHLGILQGELFMVQNGPGVATSCIPLCKVTEVRFSQRDRTFLFRDFAHARIFASWSL